MGVGWDFDICDPGRVKDGDNPKRPDTYRMINLMCYLMGDLSYREYFNGDVKRVVMPHFINRLRNNDYTCAKYFRHKVLGHEFKAYPRELAESFEEITRDTRIPDGLLMRQLYQAPRSPKTRDVPEKYAVAQGDDAEYLWMHFAALRGNDRRRQHGPIYDHLCMPFLYQIDAIDSAVINLFLNGDRDTRIPVIEHFHGLGRCRLVDLYLKTKMQLAESLLEDMYQQALEQAPDTPREDFFNSTMRKIMCCHIRDLISVGQLTALLICHSTLRFMDLRDLLHSFPGLRQSITMFGSKPNDRCCDGSGCGDQDDKFCSTTIGGGCSAASDHCESDISPSDKDDDDCCDDECCCDDDDSESGAS